MDLAAARIENMVIETVICHFRRRRWVESPRVTTIRLTLGLSERPATARAWHVRTVIIPRRTITGRLVRGQVWRRHDGRHWLYKKFIA
jgi:ribosomal protein L35AE/L33A